MVKTGLTTRISAYAYQTAETTYPPMIRQEHISVL
jgi:hypothetical protein